MPISIWKLERHLRAQEKKKKAAAKAAAEIATQNALQHQQNTEENQ
jgi:hypothetical protein